jgi:hypothetical protein
MTGDCSSDVLVFMNVDMDGTIQRIEIRRGDSPFLLARKFCEEHALPDEALPLLTESIESSMQDAISSSESKNHNMLPPSGARAPAETMGTEDMLQSTYAEKADSSEPHGSDNADDAEGYFSKSAQGLSRSFSPIKPDYEKSRASFRDRQLSNSFAESLKRLLEPIGRCRRRSDTFTRSLSANDLSSTARHAKDVSKPKARKSEEGGSKDFVWERLYRHGTHGRSIRSLRSKSASWSAEASTRR